VQIVAASRQRQTAAIGGPPDQPAYLNAAVLIETALSPHELARHLSAVEKLLGRQRGERWAARTIDLDLLLYDELTIVTPTLTVPHPRMAIRRFVLEPAAEVAPDMVHPGIGWTVARLLEHLNQAASYLALAGPMGAGKTTLLDALAARGAVDPLREVVDDALLTAFYADPAARAWGTEIELLRRRHAQLVSRRWPAPPERWPTPPERWVASDWWFDQSRCFARVSLDGAQFERFEHQWRSLRLEVPQAKLVVLLDAPNDVLRQRLAKRGRPYEAELGDDELDRVRDSISAWASQPGIGPVLRIEAVDFARTMAEVLAALASMQ
jgi:2-amino-4-hydroxy-6-hydroxymethyldihydropteridine diphosphokinase